MAAPAPDATTILSESSSNSSAAINGLATEIVQLESLLSQSDPGPDDNVGELLTRLNTAEGLVEGLDNKLDDILAKLDGMISTMDAKEKASEEMTSLGNTDKGLSTATQELMRFVSIAPH